MAVALNPVSADDKIDFSRLSVIVGQLYPRTDVRRDGAYTIFYMGINVGAFVCNFVIFVLPYLFI